MLGKRSVLACFGLLVFFYLAGCGGSSHPVGVTVTATASTVDGTNSVTLTAVVANDKNGAGVTWNMSGAGALSNKSATSVTYTAPAATSSSQTATITATSVADSSKTASLTITIAAKPAITTSNTDLASTVGATYAVTLKVTGGISPYTWSLTSGTLPACLTLNPSTGILSGTVTAACAGSYNLTFTVTDSGSPNKLTASESLTIVLTAAPAITLPATIPATAVAGTAYTASVAATGGAGALAYSITSGSLPAGLALNATTGAITGTPKVSGASTFTIKAADNFGDTPATHAYTITVGAGAATHFAVAATTSAAVTAGGAVSFTVTALDANSNVATGYAGTVKFTSNDTHAVLPGNSTLTNGAGSFQATLKTAGAETITATDAAVATITGSTAAITVNAAAASTLQVSAPSTATAGTAINVAVTAQDAYGNTVSNYAGTVAITSSDSAAVLPASSTLASGAKTFSVTLKTAGSKTVTATDTTTASITGTSASITVSAGPATKFIVSAPAAANAGTAIGVSVTAQDAYGNTATGYSGTVKFTSTDSAAALPGNSTLTNGAGSFQATLKTAGTQTITATDTTTMSITGTTGTIAVSPAALAKLVVSTPSTATAGTAINAAVTAEDAFGNTISTFSGTVAITSSDTAAVLPANSPLTNGAGTFLVTLKTSGSQTITATDTGNAAIAGTSGAITVNAAAATHLVVTAPSTATAGTAINVSITAKDAYGNTATGYAGTLAFASTDASAMLPANSTLANGAGTFAVTLKTVGSQTITATDTATASIHGSTGAIAVSAATASHFTVAITSATTINAGGTVSFTVTALDAYGNTAAGYTGLVKFTSTDSAAVLPTTTTLANGVGGFSATLKTAGSQTLTATDTVNPSITGTSAAVTVNAGTATKLAVSAPGTVTTNVAFNFTVTAQDAYNNTVTSFADTIHFSSSDGSAVLPANSTLTNGVKTFSATLKTNGSQTITATDLANGAIMGASGSITVTTALTVTTASLNSLDVGQTAAQTLTASGGSGIPADYSWSWTAQAGSSLPPGLTLSSAGVISGSPTTAGSYNVTVKVSDSGSSTNATANLTLTVYGALALSASNSLPPGYVGVAYTGSLVGSGGSGTSHLTISVVSGLPADGISASANAATLTLSGTPTTPPTTPYTISFSAKLTDSTTNASITQNYSIAVTTPSAPSLPAPNPTSLPAATVNQNYIGSISASGGVGPNYTWTVNGGLVPTNGSLVSIGNGLSVSSDGSSLLTVSGTPSTTTPNGSPLSFTAKVKDNTTALSSGTQTYTIPVNSAGSQVSGQVFLNSACGNNNSVPTISLSINTTPVQTVQTDSNGNFSFMAVPNGTYTITPSLFNPPSGAASLFSPTTMTGVTVNNANINNLFFQAQVAYTVSGTVAYSSSHSGRIYLNLVNNNCGGNGETGTSVASASGFTIHGVAPGSYTLQAWMDPTDLGLGQGVPNSSDPTGNTSVTVSNSNFTGANVTVVNNDPGSAPASGPKISAGFGTHNGVVLSYKPVTDSNGTELATSYTVAWSTSATLSSGSLASVSGSATFKAIGNGATLWILNNSVTGASSFTDGQIYYFQARANNSAGHSPWKVFGGLNPSSVTVGPPSGGNTISGNVTIPAGVTVSNVAQLYVGFYSDTNGVYATQVSSPAVGSNNPFTIHVPSGTWQFFGILDQNNDGVIDAGDVTNTKKNGPPPVVISASGTQNLTLPGGASDNSVATHFSQQTFWNGSSAQTSVGYNLDFQVREGNKLPVAVTLTSGPNVIAPVDMGNYCQGCGNMRFEYQPSLFIGSTQAPIVPNVGDTYTFTVTYSDGTQDTTGTAAVTGWNGGSTVVGASNAPSSLAPTGASGAGTTPTFTWTDPASSQGSNFSYNFNIYQSSNCSGNCNIWQIPGQNSNSNGFPSTISSITWGTDPTGDGSTPSVGSLTVGDQYNWTIQVDDLDSNQASTQTWYQP